jgi:hypothetical protein
MQSEQDWRGDDGPRSFRRLVVAARLYPTPDGCCSRCNRTNTKPALGANAVPQRSGRDPGIRAAMSRSAAQHMRFATATSARSGGPESDATVEDGHTRKWAADDLRILHRHNYAGGLPIPRSCGGAWCPKSQRHRRVLGCSSRHHMRLGVPTRQCPPKVLTRGGEAGESGAYWPNGQSCEQNHV